MPVKFRETLLALRWFFCENHNFIMYPKKVMEVRKPKFDDENSYEFETENDDSDDLSDVEDLPFHSGLI